MEFFFFVTDAEQHCKWSGPLAEWLLHHIPNQGEPSHVQGLWVRYKIGQQHSTKRFTHNGICTHFLY